MEQEFKPGIYEHYKGGQYTALNLVRHHESGAAFVVYVSCKNGTLWIREWKSAGSDSWTDLVAVGDEYVPRFKYVGPSTWIPA